MNEKASYAQVFMNISTITSNNNIDNECVHKRTRTKTVSKTKDTREKKSVDMDDLKKELDIVSNR